MARSLRFKGKVTLRASAGEVSGRAAEVVAYTGEPLRVTGYDLPVIVDLTSVTFAPTIPFLYNHEPDVDFVVGRADRVTNDGTRISATGRVWGHNARSQAILDAAAAGHSWQISIGANPASVTRLEAGATVYLNGREYTGPALIAHGTEIREISFVVIGADGNTSAILARLNSGASMNPTFEEWLASLGFTQDKLDPTQLANLQLLYKETYPDAEADPAPAVDPAADPAPEPTDPAVPPPADAAARPLDLVAQMRREVAQEQRRIEGVRRVTAGHPTITASAIEGGWTVERAELAALRASRPAVPPLNAGRSNGTDPFRVLHAAVLQAANAAGIEAQFPAPVLEAAHSRYKSRISLCEFIHDAARTNGYQGDRTFRHDPQGMLKAAFSTLSLPGIMSNVANKFLLAGFMNVDQVYSLIAAKRSVPDFKTVTSYRMNGSFVFDEVGPTGKLKHDETSEESYTNAVKSYGRMFAITRQDLINDDLGALTAVPQRIGRGAGLKLNKVFWTLFVNNSTQFASGNLNYFEGAATNLQSSSLATAERTFRDQVDADGEPLGIDPAILLVPTALSRTAAELMQSGLFVAGGGATGSQIPSANTFQGAYTVASTPYLSNSGYTGYSSTAWYLLANASDMPVVEIAYLNGVESPTVETAEADFNTLGIQMRGYFDFGVAWQDVRGGVKSKGAA